ncbi:MAG: FTR1 family iron permease [archaeon]|nr:FTR1 family iron permease [archaeon]
MSEFLEAFTIIVREGLEAILIIAAIISYLIIAKHKEKVKTVYWGTGLAVLASFATAFLIDRIFSATEAQTQLLEGITMLLAAGIMLYVTNWFLGKMQAQKWTAFIKGKVDDALTSKNAFALGIVSFFAVYREGFETVLFFKALTVGTADITGIISGLVLGFVVLIVLFYLIVKIEKKLPINIVFGITSAILFLLSLKFAGKGIHEFQEAEIIGETAFAIVPKIKDLGLYPTFETLGIQTLIIGIGIVLVYLHFYQKSGISENQAN